MIGVEFICSCDYSSVITSREPLSIQALTMFRYVKVDDELLAKAKEFTGVDRTQELIRDSIRTLIIRKQHSRRLNERMKNGPRPSIEEYLKSIEKYNNGNSEGMFSRRGWSLHSMSLPNMLLTVRYRKQVLFLTPPVQPIVSSKLQEDGNV